MVVSTTIPDRVRWAIDVLAPAPGERILDIGSGTGASVDLLVDASPGVTLLDVMAAEIDLEELVGVPVQIVTSGSGGVGALAIDAQLL